LGEGFTGGEVGAGEDEWGQVVAGHGPVQEPA
jgi:hypothetical protein